MKTITNKEKALIEVKQNGLMLRYLNEELKNDKEVVLVAVKTNGFALEFASKIVKYEIGDNEPINKLNELIQIQIVKKNKINSKSSKNNYEYN